MFERAEPRLPEGVYREKGTDNFIVVSKRKMIIHIEGVDPRDSGKGLRYSYAVWPGVGKIFLEVDNRAELRGYPSLYFEWWDGQIVATDHTGTAKGPDAKDFWEFAREESE